MIQAGPRHLRPTFGDDARRPYERITPHPLSPTIGAELEGVSLAGPMDDETFDEVHRALLEYKVIFFRDQDITPEQHVAFAAASATSRRIRSCRIARAIPGDVLKKNERMGGFENVWHSDVTWRLQPSLGSVLLAREVPADRRRHALLRHVRRLRRARRRTCASRSTVCMPSTTSPAPSARS